ncbi:precorrin-2 C(20)-methyltransferase [Deinococcus aquiradiocola]|uniref:Precorrin-2 C(20)-methyltransferase n=1 Tax=Deinococcus aquiradiocola TaxID=393059 RepID=A0A917PAG1_9DEIO|nr:precorrin-2 C(20)-methyltransferase [Deinococcus aquiradiocola]
MGVGVTPGSLSVAAWQDLQGADLVYAPRSQVSGSSVALAMLAGLDLDPARVREVLFLMDGDDARIETHYRTLAQEIAGELRAGRTVAYLTIGDSMTYSTYGYLLAQLRAVMPDSVRVTHPGITSYATAASLTEFSLGEEKERTLILPCPDDMDALRRDLLTHDVVAVMKIGHRFPAVLALLQELNLTEHATLASRLGLPEQRLLPTLTHLPTDLTRPGYLSVLLVRTPKERRFT